MPLDDWQRGQSVTAPHLQQGVLSLRHMQRQLMQPEDQMRINQLVLVKVISNNAGGGMYTGKVYEPLDSAIDPTANLSESMLGVAVEDVVVANLQEMGQSTHDLTGGTPQVKFFVGILWSFSKDGKWLVLINGIDWKTCT